MFTQRHIDQLKRLHRSKMFGDGGDISYLVPFIEQHHLKTFIDYGCGKGRMANRIEGQVKGASVYRYDPAVEEYSEPPTDSADMVYCVDVLAHVEPEFVRKVLVHIESLFLKVAYFVVYTTQSKIRIKSTGENAHKTVQPPEWWREQIQAALGGEVVDERQVRKKFRWKPAFGERPKNAYHIAVAR